MSVSFSVNTLQVNFESVLAMEHSGMVSMFKMLETTGLKGFLTATGSVYEAAVGEFFANAKVIAETIVTSVANRKLALSKEIFAETFGLPTEGMVGFLDIPKETDQSSSQIEKEAANIERDIVVRSAHEKPAQQTITYIGQGIFSSIQIREINWATHFLPKISPEAKRKGMLEVVARPNPVEEHCRLVLNSAWEAVSNIMADFDEWIHFCAAVKLRDVFSFEDLTQIEDKFLLLDETEEVDELLQRRSLLMYKFNKTEVQKLFDEHLANFKVDVPSVNHDYLCIQFLNKELKKIAMQHRAQSVLAGFPIVAPEASLVGVASDQSQTLAFEFSSQTDQEQAQARESAQRQEQLDEVVRSIVNIEEPVDEIREHQLEQPSSGENPTQFEDPSVNNANHVNNMDIKPISEENNTDHQDPDSSHDGSQRVFVTSPPASPHTGSKLEEVKKIVASLDSRIMSIDSRMLSMDSKVKSVDSRLGSMDSKIEQLLNLQSFIKHDIGISRRAFYDKIDTVAGNVKSSQTSLETTVLHHLTEHQMQLVSDLGFVKIQLAELVDHLKQAGDVKKEESGQSGSRPREGSGRQGEGPSSTRGKGLSPSYRRSEDSSRFKRSKWF
ncbi:hypothetical protein F511_21036 [Dorcoceras hygrometricum]|uniref:Uncharacterized protein n=1 Tax=Dorcoceras hygrometricum TaxID=472368 RepID=A0A2Z7AHG6_9LAMI|nr:hypothetical protein F511_21036 [Dorcoceras hygrometricum]